MKRFGIFCDRVIYVFAFCILLIILVGNAAVTAHVSYDEAGDKLSTKMYSSGEFYFARGNSF